MDEPTLVIGGIYEVSIGGRSMGASVYFGVSRFNCGRDYPEKHVLVFERNGEPACLRFNPTRIVGGTRLPNYFVDKGKISLNSGIEFGLFDFEKRYLESKLKEKGLLK